MKLRLSALSLCFVVAQLVGSMNLRAQESQTDLLDQEMNASGSSSMPVTEEVKTDIGTKTEAGFPPSKSDSLIGAPSPIFSSSAKDQAPAPAGSFVKPPAPKRGGVLTAPHPYSHKGLIRIKEDGSYQYKTKLRSKSQAASFKLGPATPPLLENSNGVNFKNMYGTDLKAINIDYEWQAIKSFGSLGLQVGTGFASATGNGHFESNPSLLALEKYTLYMIPMTAFVIYRLEYGRKQWFVPYLLGGGALVGLVERRDDGKRTDMAMAPAAGGAIGFHLSISQIDDEAAFTISEEYGLAEMWFTVEARVLQGLRSDVNYTTQMITAGITLDF